MPTRIKPWNVPKWKANRPMRQQQPPSESEFQTITRKARDYEELRQHWIALRNWITDRRSASEATTLGMIEKRMDDAVAVLGAEENRIRGRSFAHRRADRMATDILTNDEWRLVYEGLLRDWHEAITKAESLAALGMALKTTNEKLVDERDRAMEQLAEALKRQSTEGA